MDHAQPVVQPDAEVHAVLEEAEGELAELDRLTTHDQVARYGRIHDSLVQALARTSDAGGSPGGRPVPGRPMPGRPGA